MRQGKYFEVEIGDETPHEAAREQVDKIAREVLANPVIEEYRIDWKS